MGKLIVIAAFGILLICNAELSVANNDTSSEEDEGVGRLLNVDDLSRTIDSMGNFMFDLSHGMGEIMGSFTGSGSLDHGGGSHHGSSSSNSSCQNNADLHSALKIPLYIIAPAIIIGVAILIKIIALVTIGVPAVLAPLFSSLKNIFKHSDKESSMMGGYGWSHPPSPQYGAPAPSPAYGVSSSLSRQTAILNSIDEANNQYNTEGAQDEYNNYPYQYQPPYSASNDNNYNSPSPSYDSNSYNYNAPQQAPYVYSSPVSSYYNPNPSPSSYSAGIATAKKDDSQNYMQYLTQNVQQKLNTSSSG